MSPKLMSSQLNAELIFVRGHTAHSREYGSDVKFPPVSYGPGSTQLHCASQDTPQAGVPQGTKQLIWLRMKKGKTSL